MWVDVSVCVFRFLSNRLAMGEKLGLMKHREKRKRHKMLIVTVSVAGII